MTQRPRVVVPQGPNLHVGRPSGLRRRDSLRLYCPSIDAAKGHGRPINVAQGWWQFPLQWHYLPKAVG
eukprot:1797410-Amphidinium_carterae.1